MSYSVLQDFFDLQLRSFVPLSWCDCSGDLSALIAHEQSHGDSTGLNAKQHYEIEGFGETSQLNKWHFARSHKREATFDSDDGAIADLGRRQEDR